MTRVIILFISLIIVPYNSFADLLVVDSTRQSLGIRVGSSIYNTSKGIAFRLEDDGSVYGGAFIFFLDQNCSEKAYAWADGLECEILSHNNTLYRGTRNVVSIDESNVYQFNGGICGKVSFGVNSKFRELERYNEFPFSLPIKMPLSVIHSN